MPGDRKNSSASPPPRRRERERRRSGSRERKYKRRYTPTLSPHYRERTLSLSPPRPYRFRERERSPLPFKRRYSPTPGGYPSYHHPNTRRFGYNNYGRGQGGRFGYADERPRGRYAGRSFGGYQNWKAGRGDVANAGNSQREGLLTYKQFIQELEDDILPSEAERRYQEYKVEYISTQKRVYFNAHKNEEWFKDKYHPTSLVTVMERRNDLARKNAKDFLLDLQNGTLDLGPGLNRHDSNQNTNDEADDNAKKRRHEAPKANLSAPPKAHPVSSEPYRVQVDVEQSQALVRKLDSEKGIEDNILWRADTDRGSRDKSHGSSGPVVIVRGSASVKGLEGTELLDTLVTYLWRIHGVDYYGLVESSEPKGFRHVRIDRKSSVGLGDGAEWEKRLDTFWEERLRGQDPLEVMAAKEKLDGAAIEALDPFVRKIRDEKYGWKYGCGAKGCTKLFHAAEFVHKHLKLKHTDLVVELTTKLREDLYFQNYMEDEDAPGGTPVMRPSTPKEMPPRRMPIESRLTDDRGIRVEQDDRDVDRTDKLFLMDDGSAGRDGGDLMFDPFGRPGLHVAPTFSSDMAAPHILMPVPGAGPLGPFIPAPPEVAMRMFREQGGPPPPFEGSGRNGPAQIIGMPQGFRQDPRRLRSYQDLDAPDDEVTVIDYRSL